VAEVRAGLLAVAALVVALATSAVAQSPALAAGAADPALVAEGEGRWEDALRLHHEVLAGDPGRADLWVRVSDIEARLGRTDEAVAALQAAAAAEPADAALQARLSQALAAGDDAAGALRAIERAIALRPDDAAHLRAGGQLASWTGDYETGARFYERLLALEPGDASIRLDLARLRAWSGAASASADAYRRYLEQQPDAPEAWLELATVESWQGDFSSALEALDQYRARFGDSRDHAVVLARVLAGAGRPSRAVDVLAPVWRQDPNDYSVNVARTLALAMRRSVGDAYGALSSVRAAQPSSDETRTVERVVRARLGSSVGPEFTFYTDSDDLEIVGASPSASVMLRHGTELSAGYARLELRAPEAGGLGTSGGRATHEYTWGGVAQSLGGLTLSGRLGEARADGRRLTQYEIGAAWCAADWLEMDAGRRYGFVGISPRTVALGLTEHEDRVGATWTPTIRTAVAVDATHQRLSDGNRRWSVRISPRRAFVRSQRLNLDLGVSAYRMGTDLNLDNGYYDPERYEAYEGTIHPYLKFSDDVGLGIALALGVQREGARPFRFGGGASAEASFGIYRAWTLRVGASTTHNTRQDSGAFGGFSSSVVLLRRF
jgi:tetratricopeptide (TPR) repeat protein